ncbi:MAG: TIGR04083 family peptide-modifying radical SAM enzyme [Methanobrevibacter sp.]|jgi:uncharacterized protein|nr:TIGR04083 family peptide-modifying radical SAM enzyme [Candidatus Methanoflexus mossambicus]
MTFHIMIIPTLSCPSNCSYCWGSVKNAEVMDIEIVEAISQWLNGFRDEPVHFTFHGGEPLLAGYDFFSKALPILKSHDCDDGECFQSDKGYVDAGFSLQSNLWLLDEKLADLFSQYDIAISTSIDGPKQINDYQRGVGYFDKTMKNYKMAVEHGLKISFICTFTSYSKDFYEEIYNFFLENEYNIKLHAALPSLRDSNADEWALRGEEHGQLLINLLDKYLKDLDKFEIKDFDHLAKSYFRRRGTLCTFADCMGDTLAVGHDGNIYPCYRFVGMDEYVMGNVKDKPSMNELKSSEPWKKLMEFKDFVDEDCKDCSYIKFCRGGCPYNGIVANDGEIAVDPQCTAYKMIFKDISKKANKEFKNSATLMFKKSSNSKNEEDNGFTIMDLMMKR